LLKAGNLSVKCGDDLVCIHRDTIARLGTVTNTGERTVVTRVAATLCGLVWPRYEKESAELIQLGLQLFHAALQCVSILTQERDGLHIDTLVAARLKIVEVPPELLRQRVDLVRGLIIGRRSLYSPSVPWHQLRGYQSYGICFRQVLGQKNVGPSAPEESRRFERLSEGLGFGLVQVGKAAQARVLPPFTENLCPVMKPAASLARKATTLATSSGVPIRFIGTFAA
jgi:hypothetical protein